MTTFISFVHDEDTGPYWELRDRNDWRIVGLAFSQDQANAMASSRDRALAERPEGTKAV